MQYTDVLDVGALRWGRENEDKAHQEYISNTIAKHHALVVTTSSLVISPKFPFLRASPDGVVNCRPSFRKFFGGWARNHNNK